MKFEGNELSTCPAITVSRVFDIQLPIEQNECKYLTDEITPTIRCWFFNISHDACSFDSFF